MTFQLPELPYGYDALEPVIDEQTMRLHHDAHHKGYVTKLNKAIEGLDVPDDINELIANLDLIPEEQRTAARNNGGGHANHSLFWQILTPPEQQKPPVGHLAEAIDDSFGSLDGFKESFSVEAAGRFGSGWAWLTVEPDGKLGVCSTPNQDNPLMNEVPDCEGIPIAGLDVWEHAYYLRYQNRRSDYIQAWWDIVNWSQIAHNYELAAQAVHQR